MSTEAVLRALAEPQRQRIVALVRDAELPAGAIAEHFAITPCRRCPSTCGGAKEAGC